VRTATRRGSASPPHQDENNQNDHGPLQVEHRPVLKPSDTPRRCLQSLLLLLALVSLLAKSGWASLDVDLEIEDQSSCAAYSATGATSLRQVSTVSLKRIAKAETRRQFPLRSSQKSVEIRELKCFQCSGTRLSSLRGQQSADTPSGHPRLERAQTLDAFPPRNSYGVISKTTP